MPKKKGRVITLWMDETAFEIVEGYAKAKGLSVSAYINSIIGSQAGWFIPLASNEEVFTPKKAHFRYFHMQQG